MNKQLMIGFVLICISLNGFNQAVTRQSVDKKLSVLYHSIDTAVNADTHRKYNTTFKTKLLNYLRGSSSFNDSFPYLSKSITITKTHGNKIRFFSWDEQEGGSRPMIVSLAQFKNKKGQVIVQQLSTGLEMETGGYTDCSIYKVFPVFINKQPSWLCVAWGTHGGGTQFESARVFFIKGSRLVQYSSCFADPAGLVIDYPRTQQSDFAYNKALKEISYNEFLLDGEEGIYRSTGRKIFLKLINGKFARIKDL
jgi:hypothetical protein